MRAVPVVPRHGVVPKAGGAVAHLAGMAVVPVAVAAGERRLKPDPQYVQAAQAEGVAPLILPERGSAAGKLPMCIEQIDKLSEVIQRLRQEKKRKIEECDAAKAEFAEFKRRQVCVRAIQADGKAYQALTSLGSNRLSLSADCNATFKDIHIFWASEQHADNRALVG